MLHVGVALAVLAAVVPGPAPSGADVSYPQCGAPLPAVGRVAVVGVNDGLPTGTNPCLAEQLSWASGAQHGALELYVNTANPGHAAAWWPTADVARDGRAVPASRGRCTGGSGPACAWVYGESLALDDLARVPDPAAARWWLDVETSNSWSADRVANRAVIEGMAATFRAAGARVGLYSTARQFTSIVGVVEAGDPLAGLPSWLAGATTLAGAQARCAADGLVAGGPVLLAQAASGGLDADVACARWAPVALPPATLPVLLRAG